MASRSLIKAKNKSDQKDSILKSYYKYYRWGVQKGKNFQKNIIGRGCNDLKNSTFLLLWAQCISDKILKVASSDAILKVGPKKFGMVISNGIGTKLLWMNLMTSMSVMGD